MKITNVSTVYVRFYADNLPHYTNKKFSFSVKGFDSVEWTDNANFVYL